MTITTLNPVRVLYSFLYCEICETNYRQYLAVFDDGSRFLLCHGCVIDLAHVVEIFGLSVVITAATE